VWICRAIPSVDLNATWTGSETEVRIVTNYCEPCAMRSFDILATLLLYKKIAWAVFTVIHSQNWLLLVGVGNNVLGLKVRLLLTHSRKVETCRA
jgi:hypothetical protein